MKSFLSFLFHRGDILSNIADVALHISKKIWLLPINRILYDKIGILFYFVTQHSDVEYL